ncbi:GH32 C-terminal domain-containing protein [Cohnella candidum]|uniref:GH32 C-terminal domain-containing protein n=1 Tax=Cohnella candidum TaxID=2674991 RepID=UPI001F1533FC|nr:GH32 C-terminal domain-containing protein [Cohnella candidum]
MFRFGGKAVLFYSPSGPVQYVSGTYSAGGLSEASVPRTVDYGGWEGFYASTGFVDEQGRRILLGWMPEGRGAEFPIQLDWTGALALPRLVNLKPNGAISMTPIPELETLRGECLKFADLLMTTAAWDIGAFSSSFECMMEIQKPSEGSGELSVSVLVSACGRERTDVRLDFATGTIAIDRSRSSLFPGVHKTAVTGKLNLEDFTETIKLRIYVDRSTIEVFVDDDTCLSARVYPSLDESKGIQLRANGVVRVIVMEIWKMNAADIR